MLPTVLGQSTSSPQDKRKWHLKKRKISNILDKYVQANRLSEDPDQTAKEQYDLLQQSDQGQHYLQKNLHILVAILYSRPGKASLFNFENYIFNVANFQLTENLGKLLYYR